MSSKDYCQNPFGIPSAEIFFTRMYGMLVNSPKFFLGGLFWEGGALLAEYIGFTSSDVEYFVMSGCGTAIGVFIGHVIAYPAFQYEGPQKLRHAQRGVLLSVGAGVTTGTLWQISVNISTYESYDFSVAFIFVLVMALIAFLGTSIIYRLVSASICPREYRAPLSLPICWFDFMLSITVAGADAFFVGTDSSDYSGSWLTSFSIDDDTSTFTALLLAGASQLCGYFVFQMVQNVVLSDDWCWLDGSVLRYKNEGSEIGENHRPFEHSNLFGFNYSSSDNATGTGEGGYRVTDENFDNEHAVVDETSPLTQQQQQQPSQKQSSNTIPRQRTSSGHSSYSHDAGDGSTTRRHHPLLVQTSSYHYLHD